MPTDEPAEKAGPTVAEEDVEHALTIARNRSGDNRAFAAEVFDDIVDPFTTADRTLGKAREESEHAHRNAGQTHRDLVAELVASEAAAKWAAAMEALGMGEAGLHLLELTRFLLTKEDRRAVQVLGHTLPTVLPPTPSKT